MFDGYGVAEIPSKWAIARLGRWMEGFCFYYSLLPSGVFSVFSLGSVEGWEEMGVLCMGIFSQLVLVTVVLWIPASYIKDADAGLWRGVVRWNSERGRY